MTEPGQALAVRLATTETGLLLAGELVQWSMLPDSVFEVRGGNAWVDSCVRPWHAIGTRILGRWTNTYAVFVNVQRMWGCS